MRQSLDQWRHIGHAYRYNSGAGGLSMQIPLGKGAKDLDSLMVKEYCNLSCQQVPFPGVRICTHSKVTMSLKDMERLKFARIVAVSQACLFSQPVFLTDTRHQRSRLSRRLVLLESWFWSPDTAGRLHADYSSDVRTLIKPSHAPQDHPSIAAQSR